MTKLNEMNEWNERNDMKWIETNEITQNEIDGWTIWMQRHGM